MELNKIYEGDCLELMKKLPNDYFDLIITDPPYGIGMSSKFLGTKKRINSKAPPKDYGDYSWDSLPSEEIFKEMFRVSKNQIIFGGNYMTKYLPASSCWIVWDKDNGEVLFADCELAWTSFNSAVRKFKYRWAGMLQEEMGLHKDKRVHPTQKPRALGRWLLKNYAKEGDKIYDPFAGSGSFLVACQELGFDFVGSEKELKYVELANDRLQQENLGEWFK